MEQYLKIGVLTTSHGVKGEMKLFPTTDDLSRFKKLKTAYLENKGTFEPVEIESARIDKNMILIKLSCIDSPETGAKYRRRELYVDREHAVKLQKDEYFIADLIGLKVLDENDEEIGSIKNVFPTGANDVYEISMKDGREFMLPAIKECVLEVNIEQGFVKIHILDGLLD